MKDLYGNDDIEAMYQAALAVPLAEKIEMALMMIRTYEPMALNLSEDGFYVCFSGGKDSIVMARLFEMAGVKYKLHYNNVTIDPPELVQFIKREYPQAEWHSVGTPLPMMMVKKSNGPPTRLSRWCCEIYKEQGGTGLFNATGVRAAESARRKGLWKTLNVNKKGGMILCPILYWTDADVWQFIRNNQMPYCSLYDEGFKRLGCIGCPMGGKNRLVEFARWPKYEALWRRGFQVYWDTWKGVPTQKPKPCPQCHGLGTVIFDEDDIEITVTCLKCGGTGKSHDRWIERMNSVDELWDWWMQTENVNDTDNADCQMFLW